MKEYPVDFKTAHVILAEAGFLVKDMALLSDYCKVRTYGKNVSGRSTVMRRWHYASHDTPLEYSVLTPPNLDVFRVFMTPRQVRESFFLDEYGQANEFFNAK